jgi:putative molybdopterin biosynthesis protein
MARMRTGGPEFLTTREVAQLLRVKERKIYDLAGDGEIPCRRITGKLLFPRDELEAWLEGGTEKPGAARQSGLPDVVAGSHDPLLDWAIRESACGLATLFDGSLDGLERMAGGNALAAGMHICEPDDDTGEVRWNVDTVRSRSAGSDWVLVEWARRQQGMILSRDAGGAIGSVADLRGKRVLQRQATAGSQLLFLHLLAEHGLTTSDLVDAGDVVRTETEAAAIVAAGRADAAPGLKTVADQFGLGYLPLVTERFDLLVDRMSWFEPPFQRLLAFCRNPSFRSKADEIGGYDLSAFGVVRWNAS